MPGSRVSEVKRLIKPLLDSAELLNEKYSCHFIVPLISG